MKRKWKLVKKFFLKKGHVFFFVLLFSFFLLEMQFLDCAMPLYPIYGVNCVPPNLHVETSTPSVTVLGDRLLGVIKVK